MADEFLWVLPKALMTLKKGADDADSEDLESAPVQRSMKVMLARNLANKGGIKGNDLDEAWCKKQIEERIRKGGSEPLGLARYFFANRQQKATRKFANDSFWAKKIRDDRSFVQNHQKLGQAIQDSLQSIANQATQSPSRIDVNLIEDGASKGSPLDSFATSISFSFTDSGWRLLAGDPLAYGIGDIQGIQITMTSFTANGDGSYAYQLAYTIWDHFGSNDGDLYDPAQACLWLLQRKMIVGQDQHAFMPYRLEITINDVAGSGKVARPADFGFYDMHGRGYPPN